MTFVLRSRITNKFGQINMGMIVWGGALERAHRFLSREEAEGCLFWNRYTCDEVEVVAVYQG